MNNAFCYSRDKEISLYGTFSLRMEGACFTLLRYMAIYANHSPGCYAGHPIQRGEIAASLNHLERHTGLSQKTIRNALAHLETAKEILQKGAIKGANRTMLYCIVNYEDWDDSSKKGQSEGQARGKQGATSKEEVKKEDKENTSVPTGRQRDLWLDQMAELWTEITGEKPPYSIFGKWRKAYGEEAPLQLAKTLALKGRKLVREGKNTPEGYFVEALKNKQQDPRRNGQDHPASHPQPRPLLIAERSTLEPYTDPEERRHWIKEWYADATVDPDQGYPFTLTNEYLAQPDTYISPLAKRFAKKGKEAGEKVAAV